MKPRARSPRISVRLMLSGCLLAASLAGCVAPNGTPTVTMRQGTKTPKPEASTAPATPASPTTPQSSGTLAGVIIEGRAMVPAGLIANNGSGIIANNGSGIIANNGSALVSNNGGGIIANNGSAYHTLATADATATDVVPLANALAYLTDPAEQFYKRDGQMISTTTDAQGNYRFADGVPANKPVVVNVILPENRRVVGFTVPGSGKNQLDLSLATTYVTEFLRDRAKQDGKTMADFDLKQLPGLATLTEQAMAAKALARPDLSIGAIARMNMAYALAVGTNQQGLGDSWATLLGHRTIAATIVAGSGITDNGGIGKPARQAEFYRVKGVCKDKAGNIYLADEGNHRVCMIEAATGKMVLVAGTGDRGFAGDGGPATKAMLNFPRAVVLDKDENLYIFDSQNVRVRKVDKATGVITTFAGNPEPRGEGFWQSGHGGDGGPATEAQLFSPRGGGFDSAGNLYIVDGLKGTNFHTIRKVTPDGTITTFAGVPSTPGAFSGDGGPASEAKLNYTNQIWITPGDQLYMADTYNNCIRKVDLKTNVITTVAGIGGQQADKPEGDGQPATAAKLNGPYGVAVDAKGQIFISERGFHRVRVVRTDGKIYTVAGGGEFSGEGDARELSFSEPHDLWIEQDGNVLMTDTRNSLVRRIWAKFGF